MNYEPFLTRHEAVREEIHKIAKELDVDKSTIDSIGVCIVSTFTKTTHLAVNQNDPFGDHLKRPTRNHQNDPLGNR